MGDKISIILPDDLKEEIDKLKEIYKEEQSSYIRKLLWKSVAQEKLDYAINQYLDDKISLGRSCEIAGISIWEMLDELHRRNITLKYKISEAELEIEKILRLDDVTDSEKIALLKELAGLSKEERKEFLKILENIGEYD